MQYMSIFGMTSEFFSDFLALSPNFWIFRDCFEYAAELRQKL